jgi:hypothetical protein
MLGMAVAARIATTAEKNMLTPSRIPLLFALALGVTACGDSGNEPTKGGILGRGSFKYTCVSDDDVICASGTKERDFGFPTSISVGGKFKLSFVPNEDNRTLVGNPVLKPASSEFLADDLDFFLAKKAGRVAVIAKSSSNGKAADLTYVKIALPTEVRLLDAKDVVPPLKVELTKGTVVEYHAEARGANKERLAGSIDFDWTSSNENIVRLEARPPAAKMKFEARELGEATLEVKVGSITTKLDVKVVP